MGNTDRARNQLAIRGVNYDVGMAFGQFRTGAYELNRATLTRDFLEIRDRLYCNAILLYGSEPDRIESGVSVARDLGLKIWIEPRLVEGSLAEVREQLHEFAVIGQRYVDQGADITGSAFVGRSISHDEYLFSTWFNIPCRLCQQATAGLRAA